MIKKEKGSELNSTDARFKEEFESIMKNISKLEIGGKYKYPKLCELLELPIKQGHVRKLQVERIKTYLNWNSSNGIYSGKIELATVEPITKKSTNSDYYQFVRDCFIINLSDCIKAQPTRKIFTFSYTNILEMAEIISEGYKLTCGKNQMQFASDYIGVNLEGLKAIKNMIRHDGIRIVSSTLRQMEKEKLLVVEDTVIFFRKEKDSNHKVIYKDNGKPKMTFWKSDILERKQVMEIESKVLFEMLPDVEPSNRKFVIKGKGKQKAFTRNVCKELKKVGIKADGYYFAFLVAPNQSHTDYNLENCLDNCYSETKERITNKLLNSKSIKFKNCLMQDNYFGEEAIEQAIKNTARVIVYNDCKFNKAMRDNIEKENNATEKMNKQMEREKDELLNEIDENKISLDNAK